MIVASCKSQGLIRKDKQRRRPRIIGTSRSFPAPAAGIRWGYLYTSTNGKIRSFRDIGYGTAMPIQCSGLIIQILRCDHGEGFVNSEFFEIMIVTHDVMHTGRV